jgi:uracil phosphoribosyltransferase
MYQEFHHPLIHTLINTLRDNTIDAFVFRHTIKEITKLLLYEALRDAPLSSKKVLIPSTPNNKYGTLFALKEDG